MKAVREITKLRERLAKAEKTLRARTVWGQELVELRARLADAEETLRARLAETEETLRAIRHGEVDAVVVAGRQGDQVFTLEGAEHAYRLLIESMNEGALTLTADKTILYANQCFARMVKCPLEQVTGGSFRRFISVADRATLRLLMKRVTKSGAKIQVLLHARDGSQMPVQISIRPLAGNGTNRATVGMVVTDLTAARRNEEQLRSLTHRVVQVQEAERGRIALELHDNITQMLCAVLIRSETLSSKLSSSDEPAKLEVIRLSAMLRQTARGVESISHNLRPSLLEHLGLAAILNDTSTEFRDRTSISVKLACKPLAMRLPADTELALYRIFQEALKNVEMHARASHVTVSLTKRARAIELAIHDDGIGFDPDQPPSRRKGKNGLGLLGMHERAAYVGGDLEIKSGRDAGTAIVVRIPFPPGVTSGAGSA